MKINNISANQNISFYGIRKPYITNCGIKVTPISKDPSNEDISQALKVSNPDTKSNMEGLNGYAFKMGQDLIVKRYKGKDAISDDPYREINLLDKLYDYNFRFNNSQRGCYAFELPSGQTYMVSTLVEGENPNVKNGVLFTKENLASLTEIILQMDKGSIIPNSSKNGFSERCRFMNYDFNGGNIKITPEKAGLFDFEYDQFENFDEQILKTILFKNPGDYNCNQSDTSGLPSSMRSFEYWTLCDYLKQLDNPNDIFNDYLEIKGNYHSEMSKFFADFAKESQFPQVVDEIAKKEAVHARVLRKDYNGKIPKDVLEAEARKIQMANFLHEQGIFNVTGIINPEQLLNYTKDTIDYFSQQLEIAKNNYDNDKVIYYQDCLDLVEQWSSVNDGLKYCIENKHEATLKKITDKHIRTLDEALGI